MIFTAVWIAGADLPGAELPAPPARIAFGSCAKQDRPQPIWNAINAAEPELFLFLGDNIYGDTEDMDVLRRKYEQLGAQDGYRALLAGRCRVLATWDDHDYGKNDAGAEFPLKAQSQQVMLDFFNEPPDSPRRRREGIHSAERFEGGGRTIQVILLDTRYFRSPLVDVPPEERGARGRYAPNTDPAATVLGEGQWRWLEDRLREPADLRIVATSIQAIPEEHGFEKWANFPLERRRLFRLVRETGAEGVILLSGDRHLAEISRLAPEATDGVGFPLYEVTSSGMNAAGGGNADEPNRHRVGPGNFRGTNFGLLTVDWSADDPELVLEVRDENGTPALAQRVRLSELSRQ